MVNLTIRLSKGAPGTGDTSSSLQQPAPPPYLQTSTGAATAPGGNGGGEAIGEGSSAGADLTVTVACPEHLVLADLPVAKGLGSVSDVTVVKILGRKARRCLGDKVHFCVRCDFPIAIYGRLDPCEHVYCLTCARRDTNCHLCGERVLRIQRIEVLDGIFICGAPRCLRSFLKKQDFQMHIREAHADLIESDDKERTEEAGFQGTEVQNTSPSPSSIQLQEQRVGPQPSHENRQQPKGLMEERQARTRVSSLGPREPEFDSNQKQQLGSHVDRSHQLHEEVHAGEQAQQHHQVWQPPPQQQMMQGMMSANQPGVPMFQPQPFMPSPYIMQPEGHIMEPLFAPYQFPPGAPIPLQHQLQQQAPHPPQPLSLPQPQAQLQPQLQPPPLPPPFLPPRPPTPGMAAPHPPFMPPPPPKRSKYDSSGLPPGEVKVEPQAYGWPAAGGNTNFDPNWNYGNWSNSQ